VALATTENDVIREENN